MTRPTFVYDGDCAFCTSCARFIERWIPTDAAVVPWQFADLDALGLTVAECEEAVQWVADGAVAAGPDAIALLLGGGRRRAWRMVGRLLVLRPVRALAWPAYRWVARNRHRLPGGTAACAVPADHRRSGGSRRSGRRLRPGRADNFVAASLGSRRRRGESQGA
jgi:predicted DCC family thiol-disulfide oxidoreductase YuxK